MKNYFLDYLFFFGQYSDVVITICFRQSIKPKEQLHEI